MFLPSLAISDAPVSLSDDTYKEHLGVIIIEVNWGRVWKCGQFENAQLQAHTFTKSPINGTGSVSLELETPSKLFVEKEFVPQAFVVQPCEYVLNRNVAVA